MKILNIRSFFKCNFNLTGSLFDNTLQHFLYFMNCNKNPPPLVYSVMLFFN